MSYEVLYDDNENSGSVPEKLALISSFSVAIRQKIVFSLSRIASVLHRWLSSVTNGANVNHIQHLQLLDAARRWGLEIGIFFSIHIYGRRFNWQPPPHVSVGCGGLNKHGQWKKLGVMKDPMRSR